MHRLTHAGAFSSLCEPMRDIKYSAYNTKGLEPFYAKRHPELKPTIEFRQHEGALDPDNVMLWARFCIEVVNCCRKAPDRPFRTICEKE